MLCIFELFNINGMEKWQPILILVLILVKVSANVISLRNINSFEIFAEAALECNLISLARIRRGLLLGRDK